MCSTSATRSGLETLLGDIVANRNAIRRFTAGCRTARAVSTPALRRAASAFPPVTREAGITCISTGRYPAFPAPTLNHYLDACRPERGGPESEGGRRRGCARRVGRDGSGNARRYSEKRCFLTAKGEPKSDG